MTTSPYFAKPSNVGNSLKTVMRTLRSTSSKKIKIEYEEPNNEECKSSRGNVQSSSKDEPGVDLDPKMMAKVEVSLMRVSGFKIIR